jgi:hypothetical protein
VQKLKTGETDEERLEALLGVRKRLVRAREEVRRKIEEVGKGGG